MDVNSKIEKLKSLIGKKILYLGNEITLLTYRVIDEKVQIVTDGDWIATTVFDLGIELAKMKEIQLPQVSINEFYTPNTKYAAIKNNAIDRVQENLLVMIDKVKDNKEAIEQANAMVNIANSVISTEKLKLDQVVMLNKLNQL